MKHLKCKLTLVHNHISLTVFRFFTAEAVLQLLFLGVICGYERERTLQLPIGNVCNEKWALTFALLNHHHIHFYYLPSLPSIIHNNIELIKKRERELMINIVILCLCSRLQFMHSIVLRVCKICYYLGSVFKRFLIIMGSEIMVKARGEKNAVTHVCICICEFPG